MARQLGSSCSDGLLTNPPPIVSNGSLCQMEENLERRSHHDHSNAQWCCGYRSLCEDPQRTYWNPDGSMDVLHLEKNMEFHPPPNTQTKEKMRKYKLQKAGRRISLLRTAGRNRQMKNSYWSPRPEARHHLHLYSERRTPSPHKKQQPAQGHQPNHTAQTLLHKKRQREEYFDGSSTDSAHTDTYYEQSDMAGGFHSTALSPESPPEYEKGLKSVDYIPKSPIYPPPPDVYSDASNEESLIDLTDEDVEEDHTDPSQKNPRQSEEEGPQRDPLPERKTDQDPSHKLEGPQFAGETEQPESETNDLLLDRLSKIADTVNPVIDEDYWKKGRESNVLLRLNMAAQKLKEWQKAEDKEVSTRRITRSPPGKRQ